MSEENNSQGELLEEIERLKAIIGESKAITMEAFQSVTDAVIAENDSLQARVKELESMPILTVKDVDKQGRKYHVRGGVSGDWETAYTKLWDAIISLCPARLEGDTGVTEAEIKQALQSTPATSDDFYGALAAAVMQLLRDQQPSDGAMYRDIAARGAVMTQEQAVDAVIERLEQPSDEELRERYVAEWNCQHNNAHEADMAGIRAVREAVAAPLRAEIERLKNETGTNEVLLKQHAHHVEVLSKYFQCGAPYAHFGTPGGNLVDSLPKLVQRYEECIAERDTLREKLAEAEKRVEQLNRDYVNMKHWGTHEPPSGATTRPARVRFDVTAEELHHAWLVSSTTWPQCALDYLADHAVIDVPEGAPTTEELIRDWRGPESDGNLAEYCIQRLTPYLQPAAGVDPKLCEKPMEIAQILNVARIQALESQASLSCDGTFVYFLPADAHHAGMWLLSYAASQGIDVSLPVRDEMPDWPQTMREYGIQFGTNVTEGKRWIKLPEPEPIAPDATLEQLAEIAHDAFGGRVKWERLSSTYQKARIRQVAAILRAARAELDIEPASLKSIVNSNMSRESVYGVINSRIRYCVEVPPEDRVRVAAEDLVDEIERTRDTRQQQRECYEREFHRLNKSRQATGEYDCEFAHWMAIEAARTLPDRLAELDAVLGCTAARSFTADDVEALARVIHETTIMNREFPSPNWWTLNEGEKPRIRNVARAALAHLFPGAKIEKGGKG